MAIHHSNFTNIFNYTFKNNFNPIGILKFVKKFKE
jgi:hypothetical protein